MIELVPLDTIPADAVEALLDRAFGTDRQRRTAYAIRGASRPIAAISFAGVESGTLVGTIQCWSVSLTGDDGTVHPLVMIGPVAVDPLRQREGIGRRLTGHALAAAELAGLADALMLIGDAGYYGRFFGFTADRTAAWRLPGPVERDRLLARGAAVPDTAGMLGSQYG